MKEKRLKIGRNSVKYRVRRHGRAKYLRLEVGYDGVVTVTLPSWVASGMAEIFMKEKSLWLLDKVKIFQSNYGNSVKFDREHYLAHKEKARKKIIAKVELFNKYYKFKYNRIAIKNTKRQWGSCSSKSNLNFNYKLLFLPDDLIDYVVVHELCHLKELNHGGKFWALVAKTLPDYQNKRKRLMRHEMKMMR